MADTDASAPVADSNRDDLVERLKRELAEKTEAMARSDARASLYEEKERARVGAWQEDAQFFMKNWIMEEAGDADARADMAPLGAWADEYATKKDISAQTALARMCYVASKGVKRLREDASRATTANELVASTMKENEELKEKTTKLQRDYHDAMQLADERQKGLDALQAELTRAGLMNEKFDFSKATSREVAPPSEPHAAAATPSLEAVKAEASKAASSKANPFESNDNGLMGFIAARGAGSLKMNNSSTSHAFLGSQNGEADIASILRAGPSGMAF